MSGGPPKAKPSENEKALAGVSANRWNDYVHRYIPLENKFLKDVRTTDGERAAVGGQAAADAAMGFSGAEGKAVQRGLAGGAQVGSGRSTMALAGLSRARAARAVPAWAQRCGRRMTTSSLA